MKEERDIFRALGYYWLISKTAAVLADRQEISNEEFREVIFYVGNRLCELSGKEQIGVRVSGFLKGRCKELRVEN